MQNRPAQLHVPDTHRTYLKEIEDWLTCQYDQTACSKQLRDDQWNGDTTAYGWKTCWWGHGNDATKTLIPGPIMSGWGKAAPLVSLDWGKLALVASPPHLTLCCSSSIDLLKNWKRKRITVFFAFISPKTIPVQSSTNILLFHSKGNINNPMQLPTTYMATSKAKTSIPKQCQSSCKPHSCLLVQQKLKHILALDGNKFLCESFHHHDWFFSETQVSLVPTK